MALPNSNFTEIITTSLQGYSGELADNVTNHNAVWLRINEKGNKQTATGRTIVQELEYAENGTIQWYSGAETLDVSASDVFTAAEFNYKQLAGNVVINGLEQIQNSGREAIHNLLRSRMKNLTKTLTNEAARSVYYTGTGNSGKEIGGLKLLVADSTSGTVGGIASGTQTWWKNQKYDFSDNSTSVGASGAMLHAMNTLWVALVRGADKPDTIAGDSVYFIKYLEALQVNQRFVDKKMADAGFTNIMFMSAPVVYDDQCPASHLYFLNTDYLFLRPAKGREFVPLGEKSSVNQDALVMPVVWAGNMTCSNRHLQGCITA
jgi:hypothetical protein